ncbi:thyrotropin-releasing hormone receptor-like [Asterias rubens]|uniref:thyrotropin-releasing hormone receptor-like n=1 Tax=Asterias rubens TaxID=7604 RepID=UPI00145539FD|nr:thyrotropin-releasing hormone receptor-like [Asterias rubens]
MGSTASGIANSCTPNNTLDLSLYEDIANEFALYKTIDTVIIMIVNPCILAVGLLGNLGFLFVMARVRRMWTVTNIYLTNLAVADTSFLVIGVSEKIARYRASPLAANQAILGTMGCIVVYTLLDVAYFVGLCLVTLVTIEKYYAICRPIQHRLIAGKKRTIKLVSFVWGMAWVFGLGLLPCWSNFMGLCTIWPDTEDFSRHPAVFGTCLPEASWLIDFHNGLQAVPFFVCLIINVTLYGLIIKSLHTRIGVVGTGTANDQTTAQKNKKAERQRVRNQVTRMLIVNGVVFFTLMAPFQCSSFAFVIVNQTLNYVLTVEQVDKLLVVNRVLLYLNPAVNPYIYLMTNARIRRAYKQAFTFCRKTRRVDSTSMLDVTTLNS